jgi:hypothetical protein
MEWQKKSLQERIIDRWTEKDSLFETVNKNRKAIVRYFRSDEVVETDDRGNLVGKNIYNGSGSWYSRMMATGFQGSMVSKNIPWLRYMLKQLELKGIDELDIWLQEVKEYMSQVYQESNFYDIQPQFTHDGLTVGSPVIFGEEDLLTGKTMWMPLHYTKARLYYDKYNIAEGVIVRDDWTVKKIVDKFCKNDPNGTKRKAKLSVPVNNAYDAGMMDERFFVYRATFKTDDVIWDGEDGNSLKRPANKAYKWYSVYFLELSDAIEIKKNNTPLNENIGDFTQPFAHWDFDKKPWEPASRTPAWYAIWDCMSLQQMDKNWLEDMQRMNRYPVVALNSMKNRLELNPEGEMFVNDAEYDRPPKPLDKLGNITLSQDMIQIKVEALKRWFYIDKFQMFTDLAASNKAPVATLHLWQLAGEKATLLSPAIETHTKYLETTDERVMDNEVQAGRGPFDLRTMENITDIVMSNIKRPIDKISVKPVFIGRLAQAQKTEQTMDPIQSTLDIMIPMMKEIPELKHKYRWYDIASDIEEAHDFPQKNVRPEDEYDERVAADAEATAQQLRLENTVELMKAGKGLVPTGAE